MTMNKKTLTDSILGVLEENSLLETKQEYLLAKKKADKLSKDVIKQRILKMMKDAENLSPEDTKLYQIYLDIYKSKSTEQEFLNLMNKI
nr:MAG TPA: hypothetical protein [Caudoviricetes sp.]